MVDFISEVQEELRKDDYNRWLRKYGPYVGALIVLIIGITGYIQWQEYKAEETANETSYGFIETVKSIDQNAASAIDGFKSISATSPDGYAWLSLKRAAELELSNGNAQEALAIYDRAAKTISSKRHVQLAQLKAAYIVTSQADYDSAISRLEPLTAKDEPYEYLARELLGFAYKQNGDVQKARSQFTYIERDPGASETLVARAKQHLIDLNQQEAINAQSDAGEMPSENIQQPDASDAEMVNEVPTETQENE